MRGVEICADTESANYLDWLGHGTAVAAAIHEKAPDAGILVVKIFHKTLSANIDQLVRGIEWALGQSADVINLSLGTANPRHRARLEPVVDRAIAAGCRIVSARLMAGAPSFPGCLPGVVGVEANSSFPRERVDFDDQGATASPYPRSIPGLPVERNLSGVSFAVANVSGYLCAQLLAERALQQARP